jgi:hypothetical protein
MTLEKIIEDIGIRAEDFIVPTDLITKVSHPNDANYTLKKSSSLIAFDQKSCPRLKNLFVVEFDF